jgi:ferric-dicitrate binding protein FerR (iron transport regulator)
MDLQQLFQKYLDGGATEAELDVLLEHFKLDGDQSPLREMILDELAKTQTAENDPAVTSMVDRVEQRLMHIIHEQEQPVIQMHKRKTYSWIAAAASILIVCSIGLYFYQHHSQKPANNTQLVKNDVAPGRNQATLTLANGQKIILTKGLSGKLAQQGNTLVQVNKGNAIAYIAPVATNTTATIQYNTLSTARGEQSPYPLVLADGTKVWLDAASSITFPTAFNGKERVVKITGEAYFEVVHNAAQPFKVSVKGQTIEDIGTAFNINAYDDEPTISTTLISGEAKVSSADYSVTLKPGHAAVSSTGQKTIKVKDANIDATMAWKNGKFIFESNKIGAIMRQVSRWYDVDVVYEGNVSNNDYIGTFSRYKNVSEVLSVLELTKTVHFKIEGRRITVMP